MRQLPYTMLFMSLVQATMESSSSGSTMSASATFIEEHMSQHGAGLSVKVRTAVIRVLGAMGPEDEDDLGLIGEADFELLLRSGLGASCMSCMRLVCASRHCKPLIPWRCHCLCIIAFCLLL